MWRHKIDACQNTLDNLKRINILVFSADSPRRMSHPHIRTKITTTHTHTKLFRLICTGLESDIVIYGYVATPGLQLSSLGGQQRPVSDPAALRHIGAAVLVLQLSRKLIRKLRALTRKSSSWKILRWPNQSEEVPVKFRCAGGVTSAFPAICMMTAAVKSPTARL